MLFGAIFRVQTPPILEIVMKSASAPGVITLVAVIEMVCGPQSTVGCKLYGKSVRACMSGLGWVAAGSTKFESGAEKICPLLVNRAPLQGCVYLTKTSKISLLTAFSKTGTEATQTLKCFVEPSSAKSAADVVDLIVSFYVARLKLAKGLAGSAAT